MLHRLSSKRGFSLAEVLIVIALLGILASVVLINFGSSDIKAKERALQGDLQSLRTAVDMYKSDHGFYPGSKDDYGYPLDQTQFERKLTWYTDKSGRPRQTQNAQYPYGPYMDDFPVEPFGQTSQVTFSRNTVRLKSTIATAISKSSASGGWYYEPESGTVLANLGKTYPKEYAGF